MLKYSLVDWAECRLFTGKDFNTYNEALQYADDKKLVQYHVRHIQEGNKMEKILEILNRHIDHADNSENADELRQVIDFISVKSCTIELYADEFDADIWGQYCDILGESGELLRLTVVETKQV